MNLQNGLFFISVLAAGLTSCKKNATDDYPEEHYCEKFAGKYAMYDPQHDVNYEMVISCTLTEDEFHDSIHFSNYADRFDFGYELGVNGNSKLTALKGKIIQPLIDHQGNRTAYSSAGFSYDPPWNIIRNDSLYILFTIDNIAYYADDSIPYEQCNQCLHYGVKIH